MAINPYNVLNFLNILNGNTQVDWGVLIKPPANAFNYNWYNPKLDPKESPSDLAEYINSNNEAVGASIIILQKNGIVKYVTNKFYLSGLNVNRKERVQLLEGLKSSHISFFDESVRVYAITGAAVDHPSQTEGKEYTKYHQSSLISLYEKALRGSKLVENEEIAILKVNNHQIYGYPLNLNVSYSGDVDKIAQFSMQWVVTDHKLTYPGVVEESDLEKMYSYQGTGERSSYILEIDDILKKLDDIISFKYWGVTDGNPKRKELVSVLGTESFLGLTHDYLLGLPTTPTDYQDLFKSTLLEKVANFQSKVKEYTETDPESATTSLDSAALKQHFGSNQEWAEIETACDRIFTKNDETFFDTVSLFVTKLSILKNDLLTFKTRLLY